MEKQSTDAISHTKKHPSFVRLDVAAYPCLARDQRLTLFLEILRDAPHAADMTAAKKIMDDVLNVIEDRFSGVAYCPEDWRSDGRMYPANGDYRRESDNELVTVYAHVSHLSLFGANGALQIKTRKPPPKVLIDRPGDDGRTIDELLGK